MKTLATVEIYRCEVPAYYDDSCEIKLEYTKEVLEPSENMGHYMRNKAFEEKYQEALERSRERRRKRLEGD